MRANPLIAHLSAMSKQINEFQVLTGEVLSFTIASTTQPTQFVVDFEGQGAGTSGVLALAAYAENTTTPPAVGDIVLALRHQGDVYIIDRIS